VMWYLSGDSGGSGQDELSCRPGGAGSGGPLTLIVSLLTSSPVSLDLSALVDLLQLAGTLFAGQTVLLSTHADRQGVEISFTVSFLCACMFVRLRISPFWGTLIPQKPKMEYMQLCNSYGGLIIRVARALADSSSSLATCMIGMCG